MRASNRMRYLFVMLATSSLLMAAPADTPKLPSNPTSKRLPDKKDPKYAGRKKFVLQVVQSAVALPQPSLQDRLRVLNSAANVVAPMDAKLARRFAAEGTRIESELIAAGEKPAVSMLAEGPTECNSAVQFVENASPQSVVTAEQSLIGAVTKCQQRTLQTVQRKLETALSQGLVAPRALLAVVEAVGVKSQWSQAQLERLFANLPSDAAANKAEAPNFAAMYVRVAPELGRDAARSGGLKLLSWLGKLPESPERFVSISMTTDTMKQVLGDKAYEEALSSEIMARQAANNPGPEGELDHPVEEFVSVLEAMGNTGTDQTDSLVKMPPSLRARQAAAHGFANGTEGNPKLAEHYFDLAFSALNEVWQEREKMENAPAVVEEVSEAAAQVNPVGALQRAQRLGDPSAQAIGMLAVARVVNGQQ